MPLFKSILLAFAALALLPLGGCRKKVKPVDTDDTDAIVDVATPQTELQLAEVSPASIAAGTSAALELYGSGFVDGARVTFSGALADGTTFVDANTLSAVVPGMVAGAYDVTVTNPDGTRTTLRGGLTVSDAITPPPRACGAIKVRFGFDAHDLDADGRAALQGLASCLSGTTGRVRIEGHCDDRGTTEYNLALGQRRADAVQRVLSGFGVTPSRLSTVSYGEERPVDTSGGEAAWANNRRAEILPEAE